MNTTRISPEQRLEWLALMPECAVSLEWIENILQTKETFVEVSNGAEYLAICKLHDEGKVTIRGFVNGNLGDNAKRIFTLSYPDPEARVQEKLFDL